METGTTSHLGGHFSRLVDLEWGFPDSPAGKESTCNARDPGSIPGSGRSTGEGRGYPLQYSWSSLVAQEVKNLPAMQETWVRFLGWEDPLEEGIATHSSILFFFFIGQEDLAVKSELCSERRPSHMPSVA